jgi:AmmeMemoRadiSam system protein B
MNDQTYTVRRPATAGRFYPAEPDELAQSVSRYLREAQQSELASPRALIVPHAGYVCSGIVAAAAFRTLAELPSGRYTVYLMGPAHWRPVQGVGLCSADAFMTPLGEVPVATELVQTLLDVGGPYRLADEAHVPEHCLEVELPLLQTVMGEAGADFAIVPMLYDEAADPQRVADDLSARLRGNPNSLVVVSTDLSHYLSYAEAESMDGALLEAVATGNAATVKSGQACGMQPILALMGIAKRMGWTPHVVDYRNSGDTCSLRDRVVGYGAVVYTE